MIKHNVLVIEGAGAKIPLESAQIEYIEEKLNTTTCSLFDLAATTSAGTVIMSVLATDRFRAKEFNAQMMGKRTDTDDNTTSILKRIFSPRGVLSVPRYNRGEFIDYYKRAIGNPILMNESQLQFFCTAVNECDGIAHFFKSWEEKDGKLPMTEATCRSFAAPYYFGEMIDQRTKSIWVDGGCGIYTLPLIEAYAQVRKNGWLEEGHETHIFALCGGASPFQVDFNTFKAETNVARIVKSLLWYFSFDEGGIAKAASTLQQINTMKFLCTTYKNLSFQYTNWWGMPKGLDAMDNWKARWTYYDKGMELAKTIDLEKLKK